MDGVLRGDEGLAIPSKVQICMAITIWEKKEGKEMSSKMNITKLLIISLASMASGFGHFLGLGHGVSRGGTPNIPNIHHGQHYRFRPHAPGDGRWHMKYHRSRG